MTERFPVFLRTGPAGGKRCPVRSLSVYCGSRPGHDSRHAGTAWQLGREIALRGIRLVYGGGDTGIMGAVSRGAREANGHITGIVPRFLRDTEIVATEPEEMILVGTMAERKALLMEMGDAFVVLAGGTGTLDEFFGTLVARQLGRHGKPIFLYDTAGFWTPMRTLLHSLSEQGFLDRNWEDGIFFVSAIQEILETPGP